MADNILSPKISYEKHIHELMGISAHIISNLYRLQRSLKNSSIHKVLMLDQTVKNLIKLSDKWVNILTSEENE